MATKEEQETTVTHIASDNVVRVYTAVPKHIRRLERDSRATRLEVWTNDSDLGIEAATYEIPKSDFDPLGGFKRRSTPMSPERRQAAAERLARARSTRSETV